MYVLSNDKTDTDVLRIFSHVARGAVFPYVTTLASMKHTIRYWQCQYLLVPSIRVLYKIQVSHVDEASGVPLTVRFFPRGCWTGISFHFCLSDTTLVDYRLSIIHTNLPGFISLWSVSATQMRSEDTVVRVFRPILPELKINAADFAHLTLEISVGSICVQRESL